MDKPIFIRQELLQTAIDELEQKKNELLLLQDRVSHIENFLSITLNMSVGNSLVLEEIVTIKDEAAVIKAAIEVVKADIIVVEGHIASLTAGQGVLSNDVATLTAGQGVLQTDVAALESGQDILTTDVSNLTTSLTSVNAQVQLLNSGDMTILGQKTFDGTTIFNGEVDMSSTNNKTFGNTGGGITRIDGTASIGTLNGSTDFSGNVSINTGFTNNNTTIGNVAGSGQLTIASTTNLNGAVNATSINGITLGNAGGGTTTLQGSISQSGNTTFSGSNQFTTNNIQLSGGVALTPTNIPASITYGDANNIGNWRQITTAGFQAYTLNTSVYGITNSTPLPYGRYAFNMRVFIQATTQQIGYLNVFPVFTNTAQVRNAVQSGIQNQVSFGGQREGYVDFIVASGQRQVFNEGGFFYIDSANFNYPIVGAAFFLSQSCDFNMELTCMRIA